MIEKASDRGLGGGAVEALAHDDVARKKFLRMAGRTMGGAAAAGALSAFIAACGNSAGSSSSTTAAAAPAGAATGTTTAAASSAAGDLAIVNYALTLEYLEAEFYDKVLASGLFKGAVAATLKMFGEQEHQHVDALRKVATSMGTPAAKPTGKFPLHSAGQVAALASTVEQLGANAYLGQAASIKSKEILAAALAIHTVEARHSATINVVIHKSPTPDGAFGKPMSMSEVLAIVKPFIA